MDRRRHPPPPPHQPPAGGDELFFVLESDAPPQVPPQQPPPVPPPRPGPPPPPGAPAGTAPLLTIRPQEPLSQAVKRIGLALAERAIGALSGVDRLAAATTSIDRLRALMLLVSGVTGRQVHDFESRRLDEAAEHVAALARSGVAAVALDRLILRYVDQLSPGAFESLRDRLAADGDTDMRDERTARAIELLVAARARYAGWHGHMPDAFGVIEPGLRACYARGRQALAEAETDIDSPAFESLRRAAALLKHQSSMFDIAWPQLRLTEQVGDLEATLREDHDLANLSALAATAEPDRLNERELLETLIEGRRHAVRREALFLARALYEDEPEDFTARLTASWHRWRTA